jgi:hypothetical protein
MDHRERTANEAVLRDRIVSLGSSMGLQDKWLNSILRHAVSEFSKHGLGADYYGYHTIEHELEAALFTLLAASGANLFNRKEIKYLFVAALFHDYDPLKQDDKPHEDSVERFIRHDREIRRLIEDANLSIDIVAAIIHRTAYPFKGENEGYARKRMDELFTAAGIGQSDIELRNRYAEMGWFLSVAERVAGYALGDFGKSKDLERRNQHGLKWHPSVINERSVKYFESLEEEKEMFDKVILGVPAAYRENFFANVRAFRTMRVSDEENLKLLSEESLKLLSVIEPPYRNANDMKQSILELYREVPVPLRQGEAKFRRTLFDQRSILVTLRLLHWKGNMDNIIGYAKGGPLENYALRNGTYDDNMGKNNTSYLEGVVVKQPFWGKSGGHLLRLGFINESLNRGYTYVTGYAPRHVLSERRRKGENIEIVQMYDRDRLDYYRANLKDPLYEIIGDTSSLLIQDAG